MPSSRTSYWLLECHVETMTRFSLPLILFAIFSLSFSGAAARDHHQDSQSAVVAGADLPDNLDAVIVEAFKATHNGWSSDEVILNDQLNKAFIAACQKQLPAVEPASFNWHLMNLRKAGKLKIKTTKSNRTSVADVTHIAEIAARSIYDRHSISSDQIMAQPERRAEFDAIARSFDDDIDLYRVRKAAFQLRKARKLRPELITRIADWGRVVTTYSVVQLQQQPEIVAAHPGVYIFRDKTGYLYIGQTDNLQIRLKSHLESSHNRSLAEYLGDKTIEGITIEVHSFPPDSRAKETMVRRAYESELIASRKPRFNIQP